MKRWMLLCLSLLVLAGCAPAPSQGEQREEKKKLSVVTTVFPAYDWVREIAGENSQGVDVTWLMKNGVDVHSYQPTVEDLVTISNCDVLVYVGGESESWMEEALAHHPLIDGVECYKTPGGRVCVEVSQRLPILRVMSDNGDNYYLDDKGSIMPPGAKCVAHLPVVTGYVEKSFAMRDLYKFGVFLQQNEFWDAQIEQIHVLPDKNIELVPRVGDHLVYLGRLDNFEQKLKRLKVFYEKGLNQVGWNKYSRINVEFSNQIICTKRD